MTRHNHKPTDLRAYVENRLQGLSLLVTRSLYAASLGYQYGTDRDLYQVLGYPVDITFEQYLARYKRQDLANAVINRPVKVTWRGDLEILESKDDKETALEKEWKKLRDELKLKSIFSRADKLTGIGKYGVMILGLSDITDKEGYGKPVMGQKLKLLYVKAVSEKNATISTWEQDPKNPRYGLPLLYDVSLTEPGSSTSLSMKVHYTRVIHIIDNALDSDVEGAPRLEVLYNRLMDMEKVIGGSGEMFWRGARPGFHGDLKEGYRRTTAFDADLQDQIDEYEHNLRRWLTTEGVDIKSLDSQVSSPKDQVDVIIQMVSTATGIPKRVLTGSERGELSSSQDQDEYASYVQDRREEFAETNIVRPFIDTCIKYGILPKPSTGKYDVSWSDLFAKGDKEKAEVGRVRAEALRAYGASGMQSELPFEAFAEYFLGLDTEQIELIMEMSENIIAEEDNIQSRQTEQQIIEEQNQNN